MTNEELEQLSHDVIEAMDMDTILEFAYEAQLVWFREHPDEADIAREEYE